MPGMGKPDERMFSIKLITPPHLDYPYFTPDFDPTDGRCPLMNFSREGIGPAIADNIPVHGRSLVYVTKLHKFIWAIEYTGNITDGQQAAQAYPVEPCHVTGKWSIFRPIRFLAHVPLEAAPTAQEVEGRSKFHFKPYGGTLKYIKESEYQAIYDAIDWKWPPRHDPKPLPNGEELR
jgi:hypothetical protein